MKTTRNTTTKQNQQGNSKKNRPEIRDDMDSRERSEGNGTKAKKSAGKKKK